MATALGWLDYQHTLTRMFWLVPQQGGVIIAIGMQQLEVHVLHGLMVFGWMMFGKIIGAI